MRKLGLSLVFLLAAVSLGACGGDGTSQVDAGPVVLDPPPPAGGQQLTSDEYTVPAGSEKYFCYTFRSPADGERAITKVQPIQGDVVHHLALFQTTVPEPEGFHECPTLVKVSWQPIWAGGAGAASLTLPDDVGFKIAPDTQYLVQYHLNNPTDFDVTSRSAINLSYAPDASVITAAGIFALGSFNLTIPNGSVDFQQIIDCNADRELHTFAVFPHMHQLGKRVSLDHGATEATATQVYGLDPWRFGDQPMDPLDLTITQGDFLRATCTWDNMTGADVSFGESTANEMCFVVLFYYPFTELAGCVE